MAHYWNDSPPFEYIDGDMHRPVYEFARRCMGKADDRPFVAGLSLAGLTTIVRDANGLRVLDWDALEDGSIEFVTIASVQGTRHVDEFGLLFGFIVRHRTTVEAHPFPPGSKINFSTAEIDKALNNSLNPDAPRVINGVQTKWIFKPVAAAHDLVYLLVLLAWLYAIVAIPRWTLWRRRSAACPSCGYPTAGLVSPTCPECGHRRTIQLPNQKLSIRKLLRHPTTLILLTLCLFGWAFVSVSETEHSKKYYNGRIRTLVHRVFINKGVTPYSSPPGGNFFDDCVLCYQTPGGLETRRYPRQIPMKDLDGTRPFARLSIRYGSPANLYGLLMPFLEKRETTVGITVLNSSQNTYSDEELIQAARIARTLPPQTISRWDWLNLAHDAVFAICLLVWLYALISIRHWAVWKRLTPAQRRRARYRCPRCNYNLEGLAAPTCPECGNPIAQPAVS